MSFRTYADLLAIKGGKRHSKTNAAEKDEMSNALTSLIGAVETCLPSGVELLRQQHSWQNSGNMTTYAWITMTTDPYLEGLNQRKSFYTSLGFIPLTLSLFVENYNGSFRIRVCLEPFHEQCSVALFENYCDYLIANVEALTDLTIFAENDSDHLTMSQSPVSLSSLKELRSRIEANKSDVFFSIGVEFPIRDEEVTKNDIKDALATLLPIYEGAMKNSEPKNEEIVKMEPIKDPSFPKNLIFFGAPGTGKTYRTVNQAVAICEKKSLEEINKMPREELTKKYRKLVDGGYIRFVTFHQSYSYEDFVIGIFPTVYGRRNKGDIKYEVRSGIFKKLCGDADDAPHKNFVLIIDEINRGNISRVFGELITLIEDSKRKGEPEETTALLPYFDEENIRKFSVPSNVYIIGTMNTADRSIQHVDTALRRRFVFKEILPDTSLFEKTDITSKGMTVNIKNLLEKINARIKQYYDREHVIGHAYLMPLLKEGLTDNEKLEVLGELFHDRIIPLLQDYFFEDYSKIQKVLGGDENTPQNTSLIWKISDGSTDEDERREVFEVAPMGDPAYTNIETYLLMAK